MILQVGGSISFAPEDEGASAKWLSDDTCHMLAELSPKPDQVTSAINTNQMNVVELMQGGLRGHLLRASLGGHLGQPLDAAIRSAGLLARGLRKMERAGIMGDRPY